MNLFKDISIVSAVSLIICVLVFLGFYNFMPYEIDPIGMESELGATITTISGSDKLKDSRAVINTNFANLNSDKLETTVTAVPTITTLSGLTTASNLATVGTVTSGTWQATDIGVPYGGTGASSFTKYHVLMGNGSDALTVVATGTAGQVLSIVGGVPAWDSVSVNETLDYDWTGAHTFTNITSASTTLNGTTTFSGTVIGAGFTNITVITSSEQWSVPATARKARIRVVGGGGNGGNGEGASYNGETGGGGGGGYCEEIVDLSATTSVNIIVGTAGSASSFGNFCTANGGGNGTSLTSSGPTNGGSGGTATGGDINIPGQKGGGGINGGGTPERRLAGSGGGTALGSGVGGTFSTATTNGTAGGAYGSGGSGCVDALNAENCTGGAGASGVVIIEY